MVTHGYLGWGFVGFKVVVSLLEIEPEGVVGGVFFLGQAFGGHAEGKAVHAKIGLAVLEGGAAQGVDFFDAGVGHGKTADGNPVAVNHEKASRAVMGEIVGVGVAQVEGEVKAAIGLHPGAGDVVKPFRGLEVALGGFWAKCSRHGSNSPGFEVAELLASWVSEPEFEFSGFFKNADEYGGA